MAQLQNNFTTPEQSRRLLALGVPADSADCYWNDICQKPIPMQKGILYSDKRNQFTKVNVPVWSLGRLMEIYVIARGIDTSYLLIKKGEDMVQYLIRLYEDKVKDLDFSKLED